MSRFIKVISIGLLLGLALALAANALIGLEVTWRGSKLPALGGQIAALALIALAVGLWYDGASAQRRQPEPAVTPPPPPPSDTLESIKIDGRYVPSDYFLFASDTVSPQTIRTAKRDHGRLLVGFDSGIIPQTGPISDPSFLSARAVGAELEIYVEGPGGPTGDTGWLKDEKERVKIAAESVGIDTRRKDWLEKAWDTGGWKKYTFVQLENYRRQGFSAAEIDNLYRVAPTTDQLIAFYKDYAQLSAADRVPQLIMKNLGTDDLTRVVHAIQTNELPRTMFSEFHINEKGTGQSTAKLDQISRKVGIRTVVSIDTRKYAARGTYGLQDSFNVAMGQRPQAATPT